MNNCICYILMMVKRKTTLDYKNKTFFLLPGVKDSVVCEGK